MMLGLKGILNLTDVMIEYIKFFKYFMGGRKLEKG